MSNEINPMGSCSISESDNESFKSSMNSVTQENDYQDANQDFSHQHESDTVDK
jgi:hypothetical protein